MSDLVMRSVFLPVCDDAELKQLAAEHGVSLSDLVRAAVVSSLADWKTNGSAPLAAESLEEPALRANSISGDDAKRAP